jgi:predicted GNAT family N-acyltransferase
MNFKWKFTSLIAQILLNIRFPKVVFKEIKDSEELREMRNLVWKVYGLENKYFDINKISPNDLKDEYDDVSIKIGAFNKKELIGCCRLILPSSKELYVEKDFNLNLSSFPREKVAEISQFVVHQNFRNRLISWGIWKKALEISRIKNIEWWIIVTSESIKNYLLKVYGIRCKMLKTGQLTEKQLKTREKMINYYKKLKPLPYIISLKNLY